MAKEKKSTKVKSVVVAVDFSKHSKKVVAQARVLAKSLKVPVTFVYAYDGALAGDWRFSSLMGQVRSHYEKQIKRRYQTQLNESVQVRIGRPYEQIIAAAKKCISPLIVIGHAADSGVLARVLLGSTAERLALNSQFPVYIHRHSKIAVPKKALVPSDFSERTDHAVSAAKILHLGKANMTLLHVRQPPVPMLDYGSWLSLEEEMRRQDEKDLKAFKGKHLGFKIAVAKGDAVTEIDRHSRPFSVIVISPRRHKGFAPSFGSVTAQVVRSGKTSVLVLP